jgi:hypothetical protein
MIDDVVDQEVMAKIRQHVSVLSQRDYPKVWVGKAGISADELLRLQELNDEGPDWLRIEPGNDPDVGDLVPDVSVDWIDGFTALALIPDHFDSEGELGNLQDEVGVIRAAKLGAVRVRTASTLGYATGDEVNQLSEDDRLFLCAAWFEYGGRPAAMFCTGFTYRTVPLEELTTAHVNEYLLETLEFYASGETWAPYVVEDTLHARALVEMRFQG